MAEEEGLDLVEVVTTSDPPVCKVMDYGKFRYDQTKREKESKRSQHQSKLKEIKLKPNIDEHDLQTKVKRTREFLEEGDKVKVTCTFRGREMAYTQVGERVVQALCEAVKEISTIESPLKMMGRMMLVVLAPGGKKSAQKKQVTLGESDAKKEDKQSGEGAL